MRVMLALLAMVALSACVPTSQALIPNLERPTGTARIVLVRPDVEVFEINAGGLTEPKADWTEASQRNLITALGVVQRERNLRLIDHKDDQLSDNQAQVARLFRATGLSIVTHQYTPGEELPTKAGRFNWTIGPAAAALRTGEDADYALMIVVRDSFSSPGRVAVQIIGALLFRAQIQGGVQAGFAALVDLRTGDIVWFNRLVRGVGDMRQAEGALETTRILLSGLPQ